jgi:hypothetical protein
MKTHNLKVKVGDGISFCHCLFLHNLQLKTLVFPYLTTMGRPKSKGKKNKEKSRPDKKNAYI